MGQRFANALLNVMVAVVTVAALIAVVVRVRSAYSVEQSDRAMEPIAVSDWQSYAGFGQLIGHANAPVTVTTFSDFQCPYCRALAADLRGLAKENPGQIAIVYRHFPLGFHVNARAAAFASLCAGQQGRFEAMYDQLFSHQDSIGRASWRWFAENSHVTRLDTFVQCMADSLRLFPILRRDSLAGARLGVNGTPTFLVNNLKIYGSPGRKRLEEYIAIARHGSTSTVAK